MLANKFKNSSIPDFFGTRPSEARAAMELQAKAAKESREKLLNRENVAP